MVKKLLTLALGLTLTFGASAQLTTIDPSDVQFWTGTGSNSTVVAIGWDDASASYTPTVVIWGVRWNGTITLRDALDTIAAYDTRFTYTFSGSMLGSVDYNDPDEGIHLSPSYYYNCNSYGGAYGSTTLTSTHLRISESTCSNYTFTGVSNIIYANDPNAVLSCPKAQAVSVTGITTTAATVNITDTTNLNNYTVMLYAGDSLVDSTDIYTQTIYYTTLTANTGYTVKVYTNCSDGTQTASRNATFRTPCVAITHSDLPWVEDFQSYNGQSYASASVSFVSQVFCWDLINPYSESDPYINNSSSVNPTGGKCLFVSSRTSSPTILVLPPLEDTPDQLQLSFDVLSTYGHGFEAGVITDVNNDSTFTPIALCLPTGSGWNHFDVTFAGITEGRLALRRNDNSYSYIDNITVEELPSCVKPSQVIVDNITALSADITITDPNNTGHYMIYAAGDSTEIYGNTYTLTDLQPNTRYIVAVKTLCSDSITGVTETPFRTACGPQAIPYHEDFSQFVDVSNGSGYAVKDSTLPCWKFYNARALDRLELIPYTGSYAYGDDGLTLAIYGNNSNSIDLLVLPEFEQEISNLEISFMARPSETGSFGGTLQVGYVTDVDDSSTFVAVGNYPCAQFANGYDLCANTFLDAPAGARIALRYLPSGGSAKSWFIDEIDVHDMPACVRAQSISVDNIGTNGFTLHVADPTLVNHYRYYLISETSTDSADFYDTVTTVSDIAASTDYQLQVVSICNDGTLTLPITISVSTLCAPVTEVPFVENFESWTATQSAGMNRCWNRLYKNTSGSLVTNNYPYCASGSGNALNGFKSLKMYSKGTSSAIKEYSVAYLPEFSSDMNTLKVSFFYKYGGSTTNMNKVKIAVGISDSVADTTTFTRLATLTPTEIGWNEFEVELSGYTGSGNRITIMQTSTGTTSITSYIDSLVVDTVSSCSRPATLVASDVTAYGATLTWTDPSTADSYIVRWSDGTNTDSTTVTGATTYTLSGLTPSTNYTVDVRSICWGNPTAARTASFATSCAPMPLPWSMNFDNITNMNQLSSCWNRYTGRYVDSTNTATLSTTSSGWTQSTKALDSTSHVKLNIYGNSCKYWLVTPEIDLTEDASLSFDHALTKYNTANQADTVTGISDDRFIVLATTNGGTSWTPLAKWGSDTANRDDYSFAGISNEVHNITLSLAAFTGSSVRIAFYGESSVNITGGADNDLHIDNIVVAAQGGTPEPPTPVEATIAASEILYWIGEGADSAIFVVSNGESTRAWGYLFDENDEPTALNMASAIAAADPRLVYAMDWTTFEMDLSYKEGATVIKIPDTRFKVNGVLADDGDMLSDYDVEDGMIVVVSSDTNAVWTTPIVPATVKHMPVNSTIAASDILYWVGEGTNEAVVVVNWGEPDTALAWGLRFSSTTTIANAIDAIAAADPRVSTDGAHSTINFTEGNVNLSFQPAPASYMQFIIGDNSNVNSNTALANGDLLKIGESAYGTGYDSTEYAGMWFPMGVVWNTEIHPVTVPGTIPDPQPVDTLCSTVYNLPYEMDFSGYTDDQSMRVYYASAPVPECWSLFGNGRFHQNYDTTATASIYFGGIGYATSTNNFGCMEVGSPYLALIVCQNYDGTYGTAANNARMYGNKRYAVLPGFDYPLNQTMLTFNHRTTLHSGAELRVGYIVDDTSDFVALDAIPADYRITHNDTILFTQHAGIPTDARLTFLWMSTDTAHTGEYPSNYFCGIDNIVVALDTASAPIDTVTPEPPVAIDATIDSSDILFWVGTGSNHVILAVNWADTALAWGYRFNSDSVSTATMMADIAAVDSRFSYTGAITDINYIDTAAGMTDTLGISLNSYWSSLRNGTPDAGMGQMLGNGDFKKWGDPVVGVVVDSVYWELYHYMEYIKVFPMTIHPVTVPDTAGGTPGPVIPEHGPFCGAVGTEGCDAIKADSSAFVAWATGITVVRGPRDISNPNSQPATTGADSNALGMPTLSNTSDVVCLGDGGMATLTFARPIRNGEGPDFAVFENSFGDSFLELAFVEVSSDGERFVRFPATSLTPTDVQTDTYGSTDPTMINNLAGKYRIGYGTPFDLEELRDSTGVDIDSIVYVRVIDVVGSVDSQYATYDAFGHMVNDPWPTPFPAGGFDLTGVGVIHELIDSTQLIYYTVTLSANDSIRGSVIGSGIYVEGSRIEIKAVSNEGYRFVDWSDGVTDSVRTIMVISDINLVANFAEITGIDDVEAAIESLWPNPTADIVNVSVSRTIEAVLYDLSGRRVATYTLNEGNNTLDLSALQSGVYMLRTEGTVSKIVKR